MNTKLWDEYKRHRVELKSKMTQRAESLAINQLNNLIESEYDQETTAYCKHFKKRFASQRNWTEAALKKERKKRVLT